MGTLTSAIQLCIILLGKTSGRSGRGLRAVTGARGRRWSAPPIAAAAALAALVSLSACGSNVEGDDDGVRRNGVGVSFLHEDKPFRGATYDTGWRPEDSPIQLRFFVTAQTMVRAKLEGNAYLSDAGLSYEGTAEAGEFAMDIGFQFEARLKIKYASIDWEGPITLAPQFDLRFADSKNFKPFLLEGSGERPVHLKDSVGKQKLFGVPVPGLSIPGVGGGSIQIQVSGTLEADLSGSRIETIPATGGALVLTQEGQVGSWSGARQGNQAKYHAGVLYSGVITLYPTIAIETAIPGKNLTLADIPIPIDLDRLGQLDQTWEFTPAGVEFPVQE